MNGKILSLIFSCLFLFGFSSWASINMNGIQINQSTHYEGSYRVPVSDKALEPFANFPIDIEQQSEGNKFFVNYKLPRELIGEEKEINLEGIEIDGELKLNGEYANANCKIIDLWRECTMKYSDELKIDKSAVDAYLRSLNISANELQLRRQVALQFSGDPIGILRQKIKHRVSKGIEH